MSVLLSSAEYVNGVATGSEVNANEGSNSQTTGKGRRPAAN